MQSQSRIWNTSAIASGKQRSTIVLYDQPAAAATKDRERENYFQVNVAEDIINESVLDILAQPSQAVCLQASISTSLSLCNCPCAFALWCGCLHLTNVGSQSSFCSAAFFMQNLTLMAPHCAEVKRRSKVELYKRSWWPQP